jgi:hypothetical protein
VGVSADLELEPGTETLVYPVGVSQTAPSGPGPFDSFKDNQGRYRTKSLFIETPHESFPAFFTVKKYDVEKGGRTYYSLYLKYMEVADPTEYQVALRLFGSWDHWQALCRAGWFRELVTGWREELKVKLESDRYHEMLGHVDKNPDSPQAIQASKWLAERYGEKSTAKRGRPSKAEKEQHLQRLGEETAETDADLKRLGLDGS